LPLVGKAKKIQELGSGCGDEDLILVLKITGTKTGEQNQNWPVLTHQSGHTPNTG
jgi:hypothetical protein